MGPSLTTTYGHTKKVGYLSLTSKYWHFLAILIVACNNFSQVDWQDSRISRGNGKWICGKIPAGNGVRETAGKISKFWPNFWLKLNQNWSKIVVFQGIIYFTYGTHQNLYDNRHLEQFSIPSEIFTKYHLPLAAKKLGIFTEESFPAFPAGSRGKWVIFPAFPREIETAGI